MYEKIWGGKGFGGGKDLGDERFNLTRRGKALWDERFNWRKDSIGPGGGKHLGWENIWGRNGFNWMKAFGEENIWGRKGFGGGKI